MKVTDPQGRTWRVSRRWVPWRRRVKPDGPDIGPLGYLSDDLISMIFGAIAVVLLIPLLVVAFVALIELLLLLLLVPFVVLGRVVLGREWRVEAREGWTPVWDTKAGSWSESGRVIEQVAQGLRQGVYPGVHNRTPQSPPPPGWSAPPPGQQPQPRPGGQPPPPRPGGQPPPPPGYR